MVRFESSNFYWLTHNFSKASVRKLASLSKIFTQLLVQVYFFHAIWYMLISLWCMKVPIQWEEVSVTPVLKGGKTVIPEVAIQSVKRNTVALKGTYLPFNPGCDSNELTNITGPLATPSEQFNLLPWVFAFISHFLDSKLERAMSLWTWHFAELSTCSPTSDLVFPLKVSKLPMMMLTLSLFVKIPRVNTQVLNTRWAFQSSLAADAYDFHFQVIDGVVQSIKLITWDASERVARYAFLYAKASGRKRVTAVHKANIMSVLFIAFKFLCLITYRKMSDGMFLSACREVSKDFPDVAYDEDLLDRVCLNVLLYFFRFITRAYPYLRS